MSNLEVELKYELTMPQWRALTYPCPEDVRRKMFTYHNVYFDVDGQLQARGITLRARKKDRTPWSWELKLPISSQEGVRTLEEIEHPFPEGVNEATGEVILPAPLLVRLGEILGDKTTVKRVGELVVSRCIDRYPDGVTLEIDYGRLPGGNTFFEVEIETADPALRAKAQALVLSKVPDVQVSTLSKYERFCQAHRAVLVEENGLKRHCKILRQFTPALKESYPKVLQVLGVKNVSLAQERDVLLAMTLNRGMNEPLPYHTQRKTIAKDGYGDCLRTCAAMLLGLIPEEVPIFGYDEQGKPTDNQWQEMRQWLKTRGYDVVRCCYDEALLKAHCPTGYHLLSGISPRRRVDGGLIYHTVVGYRGEFYFDPYPGGNGLERVDDYTVIYRLAAEEA